MVLTSTPEAQLSPSSDVPVSLTSDIAPHHPKVAQRMALLALSHTEVEHRLYEVMRRETVAARRGAGCFSIRRLLALSGLRSHGSVKRGCLRLMEKRSIETISQGQPQGGFLYRVYSPDEIFARRLAVGMAPFPDEIRGYASNRAFGQLIQRVVERNDLTRREALIVLCCIEGMSNAEIGKRLAIGEQTVKSHLRRVFDKFGVKRRTELLSCLLMKRGGRKNRLAEPRSSIQLGDPNLKIGSSD